MAEEETGRLEVAERDVQWYPAAAFGLARLLARRKDVVGVRQCIIQNVFAVARNLGLAQPIPVLAGSYVYRFHCKDGDSGVFVQVELEDVSPTLLVVSRCDPVKL